MILQSSLIWFFLFAQSGTGNQIDVNVKVMNRDIRVHVTDKNGDPVLGLKSEDFVLKENRKTQTITYFEEVGVPVEEGGEAMAQAPADGSSDNAPLAPETNRNLILVLDSSNMRPAAFEEMKGAMAEFIEQYVGPKDLVKLIQLDEQLIHLTSFSNNKELLLSGLAKAEYKGSLHNKLFQRESEVIDMYANYLSPPMGGVIMYDKRDLTSNDDNIGTAGPSREGLATVRREQRYYLNRLRDAIRAKERLKNSYYLMFSQTLNFFATVFDNMMGAKAVYLFSGGGYVSKKGLERTTSELANTLGHQLTTSNVTVYSLIHVPKNAVANDMRTSGAVTMELENNLFKELGPTSRSSEGTILEEASQVTSAPLSLSTLTGGSLVTANSVSAIRKELERFGRGAAHYYRLGYSLEAPNEKTRVKIEFSKPHKGWKAHYGKQFRPVKPFNKMKLNEQRVAFTVELEYGQGTRNNLDAEWGFSGFRGVDVGESVPVYVKVPADHFPEKGYMVGFTAHNENRDVIDMTTAVINNKTQSDGFLLYDVLIPREKPAYLKGLVIDLDTGMKSNFEMIYNEPSVKPDQISVSSVILSRNKLMKMIPINHIRCGSLEDGQKLSREANRCVKDPFSMGNFLIKPSLHKTFSSKDRIELFFQVKNTVSPTNQCEVRLDLKGGGKSIDTELQIIQAYQVDEHTVNFTASFSAENLMPGNYDLALSVIDPGSKDVGLHQHPFQIQN